MSKIMLKSFKKNDYFTSKSLSNKCFLILFLILFFVSKGNSSTTLQPKDFQRLDQLLQEADSLKFDNESLGLSKVKEAEQLAIKLKDEQRLGRVYTMFGIYYYIAGNYDNALKMSIEAVRIHEKYKNQKFAARSLNCIALVQSGFGQLDEAIKTLEKCLLIDLKIKNFDGVSRSYFNISVAQIDLKQYKNATRNLKKSLAYSRKNKAFQSNHMVENRLGDIMLIKNKPDSAFYYYQTLLKDTTPLPNKWEKAYAYTGLASTYYAIGDYENAEKSGLLSLDYAQQLNAKYDLARASKILSEIYLKKGNSDKAYEFLLMNSALQDSLYSEKKLNNINYLQLKSKEVENLKLVSDAEINLQKSNRERSLNYGFVIVTLFLIGFVILIKRNAGLKDIFNEELNIKNADIESQRQLISKQNEELVALNDKKNQLFSIISHDLRSPIGNIIQMLELHKDKSLTPEIQQELFDQLYIQTEATSNMLNNLLQWANTQMDGQGTTFTKINLNNLTEELLEMYVLEMKKKNILYTQNTFTQQHFIQADAGQVRVIIQNVFANAIKYTAQQERISYYYSENEFFVKLHILNSGINIGNKRISELLNSTKRLQSELGTYSEEGTGLGLLLVKQFLANNKGLLDIKSDDVKGTEFILSFLKYID
jgi:signal transduction histidine kinase